MSTFPHSDKFIGEWAGNGRLRGSDGTDQTSAVSAKIWLKMAGACLVLTYSWEFEGKPDKGALMFGWNETTSEVRGIWNGSWQHSDGTMPLKGAISDDGQIKARGTYPLSPVFDAGWRITLRSDDEILVLTMADVSPDGSQTTVFESSLSFTGDLDYEEPAPKRDPNERFWRLSKELDEKPGVDNFVGRQRRNAKDLMIWCYDVKDAWHAVGPNSNLANPVVVGDLVICAVFKPSEIIALDRHTGEHRWTIPFSSSCYDHLFQVPECNLIFNAPGRKLLAIDPVSGQVAWTFCNCCSKTTHSGETKISNGSRVFVADGSRFLSCLDANTGALIWQTRVSRKWNSGVFSEPTVHDGVVLVGINRREAAGYDAESGQLLWRRRYDRPGKAFLPADNGTALLRTQTSVYRISTADGAVLRRWSRKDYEVTDAIFAGDRLLMTTTWQLEGKNWHVTALEGYDGGAMRYTFDYPRWAGEHLKFDPVTGFVYEATRSGIGIFDPITGVRVFVIEGFGKPDKYGDVTDQTCLPDVRDGILYVLTDDGQILALRHP